jgi:hypothetical protein
MRPVGRVFETPGLVILIFVSQNSFILFSTCLKKNLFVLCLLYHRFRIWNINKTRDSKCFLSYTNTHQANSIFAKFHYDLDSSVPRYSPVVGSCEHGNQPLGSIKGGEVLNHLCDYQLLRRSLLHAVNLSVSLSPFIIDINCQRKIWFVIVGKLLEISTRHPRI